MKKANEQGIQTAKLPISSYLKMSSSQVWLIFVLACACFSFKTWNVDYVGLIVLCLFCFPFLLVLYHLCIKITLIVEHVLEQTGTGNVALPLHKIACKEG
jgi:hypothetical protein